MSKKVPRGPLVAESHPCQEGGFYVPLSTLHQPGYGEEPWLNSQSFSLQLGSESRCKMLVGFHGVVHGTGFSHGLPH